MHEKKTRWQLSTVRTESESGWIVRLAVMLYLWKMFTLSKATVKLANRMKKYLEEKKNVRS